MTTTENYRVGYGRPPRHTRFKPGQSGNPKGRKKRDPSAIPAVIRDILSARMPYREGGRVKYATRRELMIRKLIESAVKGDLAAAKYILEFRAHAQRFGDAAVQRILVNDWLPDNPEQTAENKTDEFIHGSIAEPQAWWARPLKQPPK